MHVVTPRPPRPALSALLPALLGAAILAGSASAQIGNVLSFKKQSDTQGTFTATLDNIDEFGGSAVGLGDLDGAGPSAYAVASGVALDDDGGTDKGAVYILFFDTAGNVLSYTKISATGGGLTGPLDLTDEFGTSVAFLGDLDGPGPSVAAIAVGAPGDDDGGGGRGAVYILFLNATGNVIAEQKISSTVGGLVATIDSLDELGGAVSWLGDLDGAGPSAATIAVGAVGDDDGGTDRGAIYIMFLSRAGLVLSNQKISSLAGGFTGQLTSFDDFGGAVANLWDLDGAGPSVRAVAVGATFDDDGGFDRGAIWVLFLNKAGVVLSHQKISSLAGNLSATLETGDEFGGNLENLGDMDAGGAGVATLAATASGDDDGGLDHGAVYLLHLASTGNIVSMSKISNTTGGFTATLHDLDGFGSAVGFLGDLDGAGPSGVTIAVGAGGDDDGGGDRGALYILFLSGTPTTDAPWEPGSGAVAVMGAAKPNPFRLSTSIPIRLGRAGQVELEICDVSGRLVRRFDAELVGAGEQSVRWDGRDDAGRSLPTGTYFLHLLVNGRAAAGVRKAVLLR